MPTSSIELFLYNNFYNIASESSAIKKNQRFKSQCCNCYRPMDLFGIAPYGQWYDPFSGEMHSASTHSTGFSCDVFIPFLHDICVLRLKINSQHFNEKRIDSPGVCHVSVSLWHRLHLSAMLQQPTGAVFTLHLAFKCKTSIRQAFHSQNRCYSILIDF